MGRAPGWQEQRWFGLIAFGAAAYALGNLGTTLRLADEVVLVLSRLQLAAVMFQIWAWFSYVDVFTGRRPGRLERGLVNGFLVLAALCLVPHVAYGHQVTAHVVGWLHAFYKDAVPTRAGEALFVLGLSSAAVVLVRLVGAWRRGVPHAGLHALSFGTILVFGFNDALAASGLLPLPYLLDVGFAVPVGAVAWSMTKRFVAEAEALRALRGRLESLVEDRTRDLARVEERLHQAEKLAALGQFAAGVAHEVNNPASVVSANLRYLEEEARAPGAPAEVREAITESLEAMQRINALVRRLVDSGRLASAPASASAGSTAVLAVVEQVVTEARARAGDRISHGVRVPSFLHVGVRAEVLHQILSALLHNAGEAIPAERRGRVEVSAEASEGGRIQVVVTDDGAGMSPEVARRAFEPFFTTKGEGKGSGLGLAVARALAESHGGGLELESRPGLGTRALLELPEVAPAS